MKVIIGPDGTLQIPPELLRRYGLMPGSEVVIVRPRRVSHAATRAVRARHRLASRRIRIQERAIRSAERRVEDAIDAAAAKERLGRSPGGAMSWEQLKAERGW